MQITFFSFLSAVLWSSILIVVLYLLRKTARYRHYFGVLTISLLYLFCAARAFLPIELAQVYILEDDTVYPKLYRFLVGDHAILKGIPLVQILAAVWLCGFVWLLFRYLRDYYRAVISIRKCAAACGGCEKRILGEVKALTEKDIPVSIFMVGNIDIPFGFGLFRKRIILPFRDYSEEEVRYILLHEYTHFINRDIWVKFLVSVFCMLFWWNPVVYLLKRDLEQTLEIKCDLSLARHLNTQERVSYLRTIIHTLKRENIRTMPPSAATALFHNHAAVQIKERFTAVMDCGQGRFPRAANAMLIGTFVFLSLLSYSILPQPKFDAPRSTEPNTVDFDPSNAYIQAQKDGSYWLYIEDHPHMSMTSEQANFYKDIGFTIKAE